jgi:hypothetical protein
MKYYRLKKEAVPFFKEECATKILDLETWKKYQVDEKALEEIRNTVIDTQLMQIRDVAPNLAIIEI